MNYTSLLLVHACSHISFNQFCQHPPMVLCCAAVGTGDKRGLFGGNVAPTARIASHNRAVRRFPSSSFLSPSFLPLRLLWKFVTNQIEEGTRDAECKHEMSCKGGSCCTPFSCLRRSVAQFSRSRNICAAAGTSGTWKPLCSTGSVVSRGFARLCSRVGGEPWRCGNVVSTAVAIAMDAAAHPLLTCCPVCSKKHMTIEPACSWQVCAKKHPFVLHPEAHSPLFRHGAPQRWWQTFHQMVVGSGNFHSCTK